MLHCCTVKQKLWIIMSMQAQCVSRYHGHQHLEYSEMHEKQLAWDLFISLFLCMHFTMCASCHHEVCMYMFDANQLLSSLPLRAGNEKRHLDDTACIQTSRHGNHRRVCTPADDSVEGIWSAILEIIPENLTYCIHVRLNKWSTAWCPAESLHLGFMYLGWWYQCLSDRAWPPVPIEHAVHQWSFFQN